MSELTPDPAIIASFRAEWDDDDSHAMATIIAGLSESHGRTIAQLAVATGYHPSFIRQTFRYLLASGDIQPDEDNGGWMLT